MPARNLYAAAQDLWITMLVNEALSILNSPATNPRAKHTFTHRCFSCPDSQGETGEPGRTPESVTFLAREITGGVAG